MKAVKTTVILIIALVIFVAIAKAVPLIVNDIDEKEQWRLKCELSNVGNEYNCWPLEVFDDEPTAKQIERFMPVGERGDVLYMTKPELFTSTYGMRIYKFVGTTMECLMEDGNENWIKTTGSYIYGVKR